MAMAPGLDHELKTEPSGLPGPIVAWSEAGVVGRLVYVHPGCAWDFPSTGL